MNNAEQFLTDLEDKAKAATPGPWEMKKDCDESAHMQVWDSAGVVCETPLYGFEYPEQWENGRFIAAANPAAVLRLVGMVRWLAPVLHKFCEDICAPYKIGNGTCTECPLMQDGKCIVSAEAMLSTAYAETENHHD